VTEDQPLYITSVCLLCASTFFADLHANHIIGEFDAVALAISCRRAHAIAVVNSIIACKTSNATLTSGSNTFPRPHKNKPDRPSWG